MLVKALGLYRVIEKKSVQHLNSVFKSLTENLIAHKINETISKPESSMASFPTPNKFQGGGADPNQSQAQTINPYDEIFYDKLINQNKSHKPSKSMIGNLISKRFEKSVEFAQRQSRSFQYTMGVQILKKAVKMTLAKAFYNLVQEKSIQNLKKYYNNKVLRVCIEKKLLSNRNEMMFAFNKWRSSSVSELFTKGRITNKIKARLLIATCKYIPSLNKQAALLRWKVRTDKSIFRKAAEQFTVNAKLNKHNAMMRMRAFVETKKDVEVKKQHKGKRVLVALQFFTDMTIKFKRSNTIHAFTTLHRYQFTTILRKKAIIALHKMRMKAVIQAFDKWKQACIERLMNELRKRCLRVLIMSKNQKACAFSKWRQILIHENDVKDKEQKLNTQASFSILEKI